MKHFTYVANWKMQLSFKQSLEFCEQNFDGIEKLCSPSSDIIVCPSFDALHMIATLTSDTHVGIGAQDCSEHAAGPYTGQVQAQSLAEIGCTHCIVGHSERRIYQGETNEHVGDKVSVLLKEQINPIVCIGETAEQRNTEKTFAVLERQLEPVFKAIKKAHLPLPEKGTEEPTWKLESIGGMAEKLGSRLELDNPAQRPRSPLCVYIAYEPTWAIGTGTTPTPQDLQKTISWIAQHCQSAITTCQWIILYGGSVDEKNAALLKKVSGLDGFLIGGASVDFQKFQNIVSS